MKKSHKVSAEQIFSNAVKKTTEVLLKFLFSIESTVLHFKVEGHVEICGAFEKSTSSYFLCIYKPPRFTEKLNEVLDFILKGAFFTIAIAGDFNVDFSCNWFSKEKFIIKNISLSYGLHIVFSEPPCITLTSSTRVDNVFTNLSSGSYNAITFDHHFSDHQAQRLDILRANKSAKKEYKIVNDENTNLFREQLGFVDWSRIYHNY